ncbi:Transcriptional regulator, MerR family [Serinibacter arcticus]|uniref:Transcriptional regulator, MerR family n=1 Tax=Serinibacter arcticus TaxID=1655435 RepID=A0A4Z1DZS6_9MICO|nr:Transcriptional regulator, MerR family [Serinibacter arcticus]
MVTVESIGELAQRTGTSRRMLRHWEELGLLAPAEVDDRTGRRRYAPAQAGRVRAIVALRSSGFGLDAIGDLLAAGLTHERLLTLLRERESELAARIAEASTALTQVRSRLRAVEEGHATTMTTTELTDLPEIRRTGVAETVTDETEIPGAVARLLTRLGVDGAALPHDVLLAYDGTTDESVITVSAALLTPEADDAGAPLAPAAAPVMLRAAEAAAVVHLPRRPASTADAWIAVDDAASARGRRTTGPYRQVLHADGTATLAAPTVPA